MNTEKEAMMFMGDHWIGMEPFMDEFASIGLDAVVGSVGTERPYVCSVILNM